VTEKPRTWGRLQAVLGAVVLLVGIVERWIIFDRSSPTNSDEALSVLMARELWHGHASLFLWGQDFGGTLEVLPVAAVTRVFGSSLLAQRFTTMVLGFIATWLLWMVVDRLSGRTAAVVAATVLWLWPLYFVLWSTSEYLYYEPVLVLGLVALWLALRTWDHPERRVVGPVLVGLAGGLAWWVSPDIAVFVLPVGVALLRLRAGRLIRLVAVVVGALLGAAPWLWFNLRHHFASLQSGPLNQHAAYVTRLRILLDQGGAVALGLERSNETWVGGWAHPLYRALLVVLALVAGRTLILWIMDRGDPPVDVLGLVSYPFIFALFPTVGSMWVPRYFFFSWVFLAFAAGRLFARRQRPTRAHGPRVVPLRLWGQATAALGVLALCVVTVIQADGQPQLSNAPPGMTAAQSNITVATRALEAHGVTRVFSSYWQAYLIDVVADGKVIADPAAQPVARYRPWDDLVRASSDPAWLFVPNTIKEHTFVATLAAEHLGAREFSAAGFVVFVPDKKILPEQMPAQVSANPTEGP
jgi:hypothetical protein